ncbi:Lrp/AsnC family transcriptional regulator [Yinghuangia soli]|uniref:Lrp/AsnC family transcriptional regulator n=1 Tax=Yinghuangia soli TaxID=2908204 RepID=A0AA41U965_9ACTN|nr:Lrp/AsnC family transcriptional regulator [Yinghuangia soli]MCF2528904.1 Lrp/AsnC family transcriptional regulator [Yinghuangia soli]MCF2533564.1 Lrp/AsnC family transcriptional regulator [Yinghuangia soli]
MDDQHPATPGASALRSARVAAGPLDDIDRRIIAALQADGRRAYSQIAEDLGIPASSVRYRVQRLEETGVLQIVGIANPLTIGFDRLAMIGMRVRPGTAHQVCCELRELPETSYVVMTAGQYDVMVEVICRDTSHFTDLLNRRLHLIDGVVSTDSFFVLEVHKLAYGWGVGGVETGLLDTPGAHGNGALDQRPAR